MAGCKVIGIYGGAGSGKSEVLRFLHNNHKAYVIKADELGHRLYQKGQPGYKALLRICGKGVLDTERQIDYVKLSKLLFGKPDLLEEVNKAVHPMVYAKAISMINAYKKSHSRGLILFEAALLPDRKLDFIDENWYVHSDASDRAQRMKDYRKYTEDRINSVITNQPSDDEYRKHCDYVIENDQTLKELEEKTNEAVKHCQRK